MYVSEEMDEERVPVVRGKRRESGVEESGDDINNGAIIGDEGSLATVPLDSCDFGLGDGSSSCFGFLMLPAALTTFVIFLINCYRDLKTIATASGTTRNHAHYQFFYFLLEFRCLTPFNERLMYNRPIKN